MTRSWLRRQTVSMALVAPLMLFLIAFFVLPLFNMMRSSVYDPVATQVLPATAKAIVSWDRSAVPTDAVRSALVADLRDIQDDEQFGDLVRRLNSTKSGFRSLMTKTRSAVLNDNGAIDLLAVDKRWTDADYWQVIAVAVASTFTDRNLLAAVDLERNGQGAIERKPAAASANLTILARTFVMSASVTLACVVIGLPFAMIAVSVSGWRRQLLLGAVLLPLWTSLLVRTAAWFILLQDGGLINSLLMSAGVISSPLPLLFNRIGVVIAMTHVLLPFMVLPIYAVLAGIPKNLMPAAASLGANPLRAFYAVLLPLSLRGVVSGSLLVFMSSLGYYITPALIGGAQDQMISSVIAYYATGAANWGMAAALGLVLLSITIVLYAVYARLASDNAGART